MSEPFDLPSDDPVRLRAEAELAGQIDWASADCLRAAADLIDAQQARIEELETALEFHGVVQKCAKCLEVLHRDVLLAASPDTPETRP